MFSSVSSFVPGPWAPGPSPRIYMYTSARIPLDLFVDCSLPTPSLSFFSLSPSLFIPAAMEPDQLSGWVTFGYGLQPTFSVLVSSSMLVSTSWIVIVLSPNFPFLRRVMLHLGMEEVTLVHRVVCHAVRFCIAARQCPQDSQPCSHRGGTMPWGEVAA